MTSSVTPLGGKTSTCTSPVVEEELKRLKKLRDEVSLLVPIDSAEKALLYRRALVKSSPSLAAPFKALGFKF